MPQNADLTYGCGLLLSDVEWDSVRIFSNMIVFVRPWDTLEISFAAAARVACDRKNLKSLLAGACRSSSVRSRRRTITQQNKK
mmetsp:Transcript_16498/g.47456  ORF Transcript_16498/g.47456 Transcript_16498/m.47456 type:complete len:83 (+) Transcript_16498:236-484(+)